MVTIDNAAGSYGMSNENRLVIVRVQHSCRVVANSVITMETASSVHRVIKDLTMYILNASP